MSDAYARQKIIALKAVCSDACKTSFGIVQVRSLIISYNYTTALATDRGNPSVSGSTQFALMYSTISLDEVNHSEPTLELIKR